MYHYFYKIVNNINGNYYYGVHSTNNIDDGYMGSGKRLGFAKKKYGIENFTKYIIKFFDTRKDAYEYEAKMVTEELVFDSSCYNMILGGNECLTQGMTAVYDKHGNRFLVRTDDPKFISGEYVSVQKNHVLVKDSSGNYYFVPTDDKRYISGEFISAAKGLSKYIDNEGNVIVCNKEEADKKGFISFFKNRISVKDKDGNNFNVLKTDKRYISGELVPVWCGKKHTEESKQKMRETKQSTHSQKGEKNSQYGTRWMTNGSNNIKVKSDDIEKYINEGYTFGRKLVDDNKRYDKIFVETTCPVCGKTFNIKKRYLYGGISKCCSRSCASKFGWNLHKNGAIAQFG